MNNDAPPPPHTHTKTHACDFPSKRSFKAGIDFLQEDNTQAALHMQKALELAPDCAEYASDLDRLLRRIPDRHVEALQASPVL